MLASFARQGGDWESLDPLDQEVTAFHILGVTPRGRGLDEESAEFVKWAMIYKDVAAEAENAAVKRAMK